MMSEKDDLFGLEFLKKVEDSGVRNIFTPHTPVKSVELFFGRQDTVQGMIDHLNTPGQHALLYGDRGVGKSSLANITTTLLIEKILDVKLFAKRCSSLDNLLTIFRGPLESVGVSIEEKSTSKSRAEGGHAGLDIRIVSAGVKSTSGETVEYINTELTPSNIAELLSDYPGLLYVDEFDQLESEHDKKLVAETIKLLSDIGSPFKLLLVGIAETGEQLVAGHRSVERCLKETKLDRMQPSEIRDLLLSGTDKIGFTFDRVVVDRISHLCAGYPHFAHLLALKCVEEAIKRNVEVVDTDLLFRGIKSASKEAEGTLRRKYDKAVRSASTEMFKVTLIAAAQVGSEGEFNSKDWREEVQKKVGQDVTAQKLGAYVSRLVSNDESALIRRVGKGVYKFNDPRMPSFIKIVNWSELKNE